MAGHSSGHRSSTRRRSSTRVAGSSSRSSRVRSRWLPRTAAATRRPTPRSPWPSRRAKDASMPRTTSSVRSPRGTGEGSDAAAIETVLYEGYGPGGVALLVEALTDNRNRTSANVRHLFSKGGGSLGEPGPSPTSSTRRASRSSTARPTRGRPARRDRGRRRGCRRRRRGHRDHHRARRPHRGARRDRIRWHHRPQRRGALPPEGRTQVDDEAQARTLLKLIDLLEGDDDVSEVHANFDIDDEILERVLA